MNKQEHQVQNLIALKRYENPRDGYFEDFLEEFQRRQRKELLQRSSVSLFFERVGTWFSEFGSAKWIYGAGAAYACLLLAFAMWPSNGGGPVRAPGSPVSYEPVPGQPVPAVDFGKGSGAQESHRREF